MQMMIIVETHSVGINDEKEGFLRNPHEDVDSSCCGATKCFTEASDAWRVNNDWVEEFLSIGPMTGRGKVLVVLPREMRNSQKSIRL